MKKVLWIAACTCFGFVAMGAAAQTAIQPGSIVGTFGAQNYFTGSFFVIYTVPSDRAARVTDVIVVNYNAGACNAGISMGGTNFFVRVPPNDTVAVSLGTGYGITANGTVQLGGTDCPSNLYAQVRGFNFTVP